ncbi:MAG: hypothetical protein KatS3mg115_1399 [Candidatus Poribacteria bacterium]|nr:MAG: hypothetical protein KatS3mg115_1399 [Candidatus Poribacteria bacterium]
MGPAPPPPGRDKELHSTSLLDGGGATPSRIRWRAILITTPLIPFNQWWVTSSWTGYTLTSLFVNAAFILFLLIGWNELARKLTGRPFFWPAELALAYTMISVATGTAGHDTIEMLTQALAYPYYFASPENDWQALFFHYLPEWLMMPDTKAAEGLYRIGASFFEPHVWRAWLRPILYWSLFLIVLYWAMLCLTLIFRRQWVERERLAFPVAQLPYGLIHPGRRAFGDRRFWIGFGLAAFLSLFNGLHRLFPVVPGLTYGKVNIGDWFTDPPWNAIDVAYIEFLPFVMGLAFFIPVDLSFSIWFFYWFWKLLNVLGRATGLHSLPGYPGYWSQGAGGIFVLCLLLLYWSRRHLGDVLRAAWGGRRDVASQLDQYRLAVWGLLVSGTFLVGFLVAAGMALWFAVLFLAGYFGFSLVTTRLRAQLGPPTHEIPFTTSGLYVALLTPKRIPARTLTQISVFKFLDFGQRGNPMPYMMEGWYLRDRLRSTQTARIVVGLAIAIVLGTLAGFVGNLSRGYRYTNATWVGEWAFPTLAGWLQLRIDELDWVYLTWFAVGGGVVTLLSLLGRSFVWWPLHPLGYLMGNEWMLRHFWFSVFLAWAIRATTLKLGGIRGHRALIPVFLGITVGDAVCLALWSIIGQLFNVWTLGLNY